MSDNSVVEKYVEEYKKIALSVEPTDQQAAETAVKELYKYLGFNEPKFVWLGDPFQAKIEVAKKHFKTDNPTDDQVKEVTGMACYGSLDVYWPALYDYSVNNMAYQDDGLLPILSQIVKQCGVFWTFDDVAYMTPKPKKISINDKFELHNTEGPALEYANGKVVYCVDNVPKKSLMEVMIDGELSE